MKIANHLAHSGGYFFVLVGEWSEIISMKYGGYGLLALLPLIGLSHGAFMFMLRKREP